MKKEQKIAFFSKNGTKNQVFAESAKINMITFIVKNHTIIVSGCKEKVEWSGGEVGEWGSEWKFIANRVRGWYNCRNGSDI